MERAFRLQQPHRGVAGGVDVVNIYELERDREHARLGSYVCPDPACHAAVRPAFPVSVRPSRRRSPRCYFSAHPPSRHNAACRGELVLVEVGDWYEATGSRGEPRPVRQAIPSRFREDVRPAAPRQSVDAAVDEQTPETRRRYDTKAHAAGGATSQSSVSTVKSLALHWLNAGSQVEHAALRIPGCRGTTYGECFEPLPASRSTIDRRAGSRAVFYGAIVRAERWGGQGVCIVLLMPDDNAPAQDLWIKLDESMVRGAAALIDRLSAKPLRLSRVYALGEFVPFKGGWRMTITDPRHFWVE